MNKIILFFSLIFAFPAHALYLNTGLNNWHPVKQRTYNSRPQIGRSALRINCIDDFNLLLGKNKASLDIPSKSLSDLLRSSIIPLPIDSINPKAVANLIHNLPIQLKAIDEEVEKQSEYNSPIIISPQIEHIVVGRQSSNSCGAHALKNAYCLLTGDIEGLQTGDLKGSVSPFRKMNAKILPVETIRVLFPNIKIFKQIIVRTLYPFCRVSDLTSLNFGNFKDKFVALDIKLLINDLKRLDLESLDESSKNIMNDNIRCINEEDPQVLDPNTLADKLKTINLAPLIKELECVNLESLNLNDLDKEKIDALGEVMSIKDRCFIVENLTQLSETKSIKDFPFKLLNPTQLAKLLKFFRDPTKKILAVIAGDMRFSRDAGTYDHWVCIVTEKINDNGSMIFKCADSNKKVCIEKSNALWKLFSLLRTEEAYKAHMEYLFRPLIPTPEKYEHSFKLLGYEAVETTIKNLTEVTNIAMQCDYNTMSEFQDYATDILRCLDDIAKLDQEATTPLISDDHVKPMRTICDFALATKITQEPTFNIQDEYPNLHGLLNPKDSASSSDETASTDTTPSPVGD